MLHTDCPHTFCNFWRMFQKWTIRKIPTKRKKNFQFCCCLFLKIFVKHNYDINFEKNQHMLQKFTCYQKNYAHNGEGFSSTDLHFRESTVKKISQMKVYWHLIKIKVGMKKWEWMKVEMKKWEWRKVILEINCIVVLKF